jgi:hypothetical protein
MRVLLLPCGLAALASAQSAPPPTATRPAATPAVVAGDFVPSSAAAPTHERDPDAFDFHGLFGGTITSAYFRRGILQEEDGVIVEPFLELGKPLHRAPDSAVSRVDLRLGQWNSLHDGPTGSDTADQSIWYEHDFQAAVEATLWHAWTVAARYTAFYSPNGSFDTIQEVGVDIAHRGAAAPSGERGAEPDALAMLAPSLRLAFETAGQADGGNEPGVYAELGLTPEVELQLTGERPTTLTMPLRLGLSLHDYYEDASGRDSTFGFFDLGIEVGQPIGHRGWLGQVGLHALFLGESNRERSGDDIELVATLSILTRF